MTTNENFEKEKTLVKELIKLSEMSGNNIGVDTKMALCPASELEGYDISKMTSIANAYGYIFCKLEESPMGVIFSHLKNRYVIFK